MDALTGVARPSNRTPGWYRVMARKHRAYWKGYLRLSLVTIGVEVYNGVESKGEISFRQIHKPSGRLMVATPTMRDELEQQRALAHAGLAADEHHAPLHEPAAQHAVDLGHPRHRARRLVLEGLRQRDGLRARAAHGDVLATRAARDGLLDDGVPRVAFEAATRGLGVGGAAGLADEAGVLHDRASYPRTRADATPHRT
mgnify:CR=1 FL=1